MKDEHAKLSGSYCTVTTGLSAGEASVCYFFPLVWQNLFRSGLGWWFWRETPSQKEAGPFRDDFCKIRVETQEARETGMISLVQELPLVWVPVLPPPFAAGSLGLGWMCAQSELGVGPSYPCGSVFMVKPRHIYCFSASRADGSFHVLVLQRLLGRCCEAVTSKGAIQIWWVFSSLRGAGAYC